MIDMTSSTGGKRRFHHSIRFKLLLLALTLLVIPWAGYRYIQETEHFLRNAQETSLQGTAQAVAAILGDREEMFMAGTVRSAGQGEDSAIYIQSLDTNIQLDGYLDDWRPYLLNLSTYTDGKKARFDSLVGEKDGYLFLLFQVHDDHRVYQKPGDSRLDQSDGIELTLEQPDGTLVHYVLTTLAPGWINAQQTVPGGDRAYPLAREERIKGEWQENSAGYTLELRIPTALVGNRMTLGVIDVDDPERREILAQVASTPQGRGDRPGPLIRTDPEMKQMVDRLVTGNSRIWVVDRNRRVLTQGGQLTGKQAFAGPATARGEGSLLALLFRLILDQPTESFEDDFAGTSRLKGPEIDAALAGESSSRRRSSPDQKAVIVSAAWPIRSSQGVVGAVLVEQSSNQILSLHNEALERLITISLILFSVVGLVLLGFATLHAGRIRRLRNRVEAVVSPDGRILGSLPGDRSKDEIGDLNRSFGGVLGRLSEYNRYLEAMASRLAHELRTPLTIVSSSLENLESDPSPENTQHYIDRARTGTERLQLILNRMREAARLEQLLSQTQLEPCDLKALIGAATDGYRLAFPGVVFELQLPAEPVRVFADPDLLSQALDKLISNAVDFHNLNTPICLELSPTSSGQVCLSIINQGPPLPPGMEQALFQSLISIRSEREAEPHLGLGLYLVQLIVEFHGGRTEARNLKQEQAVCFDLWLPSDSSR